MKTKTMAGEYDAYYYAHCCGVPYDKEHLWDFFTHIADRVISDIAPKTVLDAGCAKGFFVQALRQHGVEAWGIDISKYAISQVDPEAKPYCRVGSISEPFDRQYDLIVCQEVLEHMPPKEACRAIENICNHTEDVLFSSSPIDFTEPTHLNVQPPEFWALQFARLGFYRDLDFDAHGISIPWAMRFRKMKDPLWHVTGAYERRLWHVTQEFDGMRTSLLNQQGQLAEKEKAVTQLQQELKALGAKRDSQVQQLQDESQRLVAEKDKAVVQLQQELQALGAQRDSQVRQLNDELQRMVAEKEARIISRLRRCLRKNGKKPAKARASTLVLYGHATRKKIQHAMRERRLWRMVVKGTRLFLSGRLGLMGQKLLNELAGEEDTGGFDRYAKWREHYALTDERRAQIRGKVASMTAPPKISLVVPPYEESSPQYLREMFESVQNQLYPHWQLCFVHGGAVTPQEKAVIDLFVTNDDRIIEVHSGRGRNMAVAINLALQEVAGDFVGLLGANDQLAEHALFRIAEAIEQEPSVDMLYSDEDKITPDGIHCRPFFKPDWSPEYFLSTMYTSCLSLHRKALVDKLGGFRKPFGLACEYDLALRLTSQTSRIKHIADILYHKRLGLPPSVGAMERMPSADKAARKALKVNLAAGGKEILRIEPGPELGYHRVRFKIIGNPKVTIVIPTACKQGDFGMQRTWFLLKCIQSIRAKTNYANYEILVADNGDMPPELAEAIQPFNPIRISYTRPGPFNLSAKFNFAVNQAAGTHVLLLNDDVEVITPDWITNMLEYSQQESIGAVGCKLHFPNGSLQHVGVIIFGVGPGHPFYQCPHEYKGYHNSTVIVRNVSAVTGSCLMSRKSAYQEVGGFSEYLPLDYNDVDYCLKLNQKGYRVVYTPHTEICHYESATRSNTWESGINIFKKKWPHLYSRDPYYSGHLTQCNSDHRIALPWLGAEEG